MAKKTDRYRNAAILLLSLGEEATAAVFKQMSRGEVHEISQAMSAMPTMKRLDVQNVINGFFYEYRYESGIAGGTRRYLENALKIALGENDARGMLDSIFDDENSRCLEVMKWMDPNAIASLIINEHPQLQAVVLSYLESEQAAEVLSRLPERNHKSLLKRIAALEELSPEIIKELNLIFDDPGGDLTARHSTQISGMKQVAGIMNSLGEQSANDLLEHFKTHNADMAVELEQEMFIFEHLAMLDEEAVQRILQEVPQELLALAMKGAPDNIFNKVVGTMTKRTANYLKNNMDALGVVRASQVKDARKEVMEIARKLAKDGEITRSLTPEEMVE